MATRSFRILLKTVLVKISAFIFLLLAFFWNLENHLEALHDSPPYFEISDDHASTTNQNGGQNEEYITSDSAMLSYTPGVNSRAELLLSTRVYAWTALRAVVRGQNWQTSHMFFSHFTTFRTNILPFYYFSKAF
jgi:hypothetical protein